MADARRVDAHQDRLRMRQVLRTPVLIVGGGPVGLALAGELGWHGVACTLVEQGDGTIVTPKMNEVNVRTMEFCRRWGIADAVHACPFPPDYPLDVAFVTSLSGYELGLMPRPPRMSEAPEPHSPMRLQVCSQMWFDPILQRFARTFPNIELRHRTRLEWFEAGANGVSAEILDLASGQRERLSGRLRRRQQHGSPRAWDQAGWQNIGSSSKFVLSCPGAPGVLRPQAHDLLCYCRSWRRMVERPDR